MQTKNTLKYHYTPKSEGLNKIMTPPMGGKDHSYNTSGECRTEQPLWKMAAVSLKSKHAISKQPNTFLCLSWRISYVHTETCTLTLTASL